MTMAEAAIWRSSAEYMSWRAALSFIIFLKDVFTLNLGLKQRNHLKTLSMSFILQGTVIDFAGTALDDASANI